jgi:2-polyprenyl-3-methyl-5-hydroxy-6-metoxy-1,4-benzoquinol methylase
MYVWTRQTPLDYLGKTDVTETWTYSETGQALASFPVHVKVGKPLDMRAFKGSPLQDIQDYAAVLAQNAQQLYAPNAPLLIRDTCPCCEGDGSHFVPVLAAFTVDYVRCGICGHVFVGKQPTAEAINEAFRESDSLASVYTDSASLEFRLKNIVSPKLEWALNVFTTLYPHAAHRVVDVGAGGGHFVETARRAGLLTEGYEINQASRDFARRAWGFELIAEDYLTSQLPAPADIVTFWGLLEYTPEPRHFLEKARTQLENGLLIVEVPRFEAISSISQQLQPHFIARHLDPTSHLNCFSDSSLATALYQCGFKPVAAWYFGMDAYELIAQIALAVQNPETYEALADWIPDLQAAFDAARLCDDIIIAAVPY